MSNKIIIYKIIIFILLLIIEPNLLASNQDNLTLKALQLFDKENYDEAEKIFEQLIENDPDNTMLNYYYGACRTENGHFSENDLNYLLDAGEKVTPHRINYYLGMQYHALNNWGQALKYYNQFRLSVPEEEQMELGLTKKIQQCYDKVNPYDNAIQKDFIEKRAEEKIKTEAPKSEGVTKDDKTIKIKDTETQTIQITDSATSVLKENGKVAIPVEKPAVFTQDDLKIPRKALPDLPGVKPTVSLPQGEYIEFQINNKITYLHTSQFQTDEGKQIFSEINLKKKELDNTLKKADQLRGDYLRSYDAADKENIGEKILSLENESYNIKEKITRLSSICRNIENEYWKKAGSTEVNNFILEIKKIETARQNQLAESSVKTEITDTLLVISPNNLLNLNEVRKRDSQKSQTSNLVYKIQIGAFSRGVPAYMQRIYNKLSLIRKIESYKDEDGVVVYTTGNLSNPEDAMKMIDQVRQEGIKDAHIVPYFKGKRITLEQAKEIEADNEQKRN